MLPPSRAISEQSHVEATSEVLEVSDEASSSMVAVSTTTIQASHHLVQRTPLKKRAASPAAASSRKPTYIPTPQGVNRRWEPPIAAPGGDQQRTDGSESGSASMGSTMLTSILTFIKQTNNNKNNNKKKLILLAAVAVAGVLALMAPLLAMSWGGSPQTGNSSGESFNLIPTGSTDNVVEAGEKLISCLTSASSVAPLDDDLERACPDGWNSEELLDLLYGLDTQQASGRKQLATGLESKEEAVKQATQQLRQDLLLLRSGAAGPEWGVGAVEVPVGSKADSPTLLELALQHIQDASKISPLTKLSPSARAIKMEVDLEESSKPRSLTSQVHQTLLDLGALTNFPWWVERANAFRTRSPSVMVEQKAGEDFSLRKHQPLPLGDCFAYFGDVATIVLRVGAFEGEAPALLTHFAIRQPRRWEVPDPKTAPKKFELEVVGPVRGVFPKPTDEENSNSQTRLTSDPDDSSSNNNINNNVSFEYSLLGPALQVFELPTPISTPTTLRVNFLRGEDEDSEENGGGPDYRCVYRLFGLESL